MGLEERERGRVSLADLSIQSNSNVLEQRKDGGGLSAGVVGGVGLPF